eukprot:Tbor_TRINITY_DN5337_c1_g1::TRINITY_DN5337_c1_g1_i1::g.4207::m.4207/K01507/ppa; inorganic pyrophosphatase
MLFTRDVYKHGVRAPQVFARKESGTRFQKDWSLQFTALFANSTNILDLPPVSPWHAIMTKQYINENIFNYVNEIPRGTREKMEIDIKREFNPIRQDITKDGSLRKFTYGDIPFNYGCLPRTWENPNAEDKIMTSEGGSNLGRLVGDGDPVDVVELSGSALPIGSVSQVRVLGCLALVDQGEADWKILVSDLDDPSIRKLSDVPNSRINDIVDWFRNYKITDGKEKNEFAFDGKVQNEAVTFSVIKECQDAYNKLRSGEIINTGNWWLPSK